MTQEHPVIDRYIARFEGALGQLDGAARKEIVLEIRNHIEDAVAAGKPMDVVLNALGPADALARAYAVELLINRREKRPTRRFWRFFPLIGLVAFGGLATFTVVIALGSVGLGFVASGITMFAIGILESMQIHLPGVQMNDFPPALAIVLGPIIFAMGIGAFMLLRMYVRMVANTWRRMLPRQTAASTTA
jgi:uncharacterized membrane protein